MKSSRTMRPVLVAMATAVATIVPLAGFTTPASQGAVPSGHHPATARKADKAVIVPGRYIVMTKGASLASYRGGTHGFVRTRPLPGHKLNVHTAAARSYKHHLLSGHRSVLARAGISLGRKTSDYSVAFNGFSAKLTKAQAAKLSHTPGVTRVWPVEMRTADTVSTPKFLGLDGDGGVWQKQFGGSANSGRGMIIADLDSGIWPESHSFDALSSTPDQATIDLKWHGICDVGVQQPIACNNKIIGARYYGAAYGNRLADDFNSPRDYNGHGSHTASTAAGDHATPVVINGIPLGDASGMAPAARIAVYKVLWENKAAGNASGTTAGIVQAIDDAVADGADVINYSISGSSTSIVSPDELAFLGAADAGVFVSASAGNSGPTASTVAHNAPWETTVAADTHDRGAIKSVTLGNGAKYTGLGYGPGVGPAPLINSTAAVATNATAANLCFSAEWPGGGGLSLDPAKVTGKIVVCTRGTNDRVDKSRAVKEAGGIGMVLADNGAGITADFHSVPTVHINLADGNAVKAYAATDPDPTATISATDTSPVEAPAMAGFSSRGPALAGGGDLLKPDIAAPGVGVIAAVAPPGNNGMDFNSYDGTSMAAPHITGIAALIMQKHPTWSPMWVKSAIMTTATTLDNRGNPIAGQSGNATPLDFGSGHVQPAPAFDPGLVYDSTTVNWLQYGCSIGQIQPVAPAGFCDQFPAIDPSDFNSPSIAIGALAGSQKVSRTFTNVSTDQASQYKATIQAPPGTTVTVNDDKITVPPMQSRSYSLTITRTTAAFDQWAFGSITWTDKRGHSVTSPIAVKPVAAAFASAVNGTGTSGSQTIAVQPGYTGTLTATPVGLVPATVTTVTANTGASGSFDVTIPAGTSYARFATYDADYPAGTDVDLLVTQGTTTVGSSGGATAEEVVNLVNPPAGTYTVKATYFAGATPSLAMKVNSFLLGSTAAGNLTVTPASQPVTTGEATSVTATWSGLAADTRYLGAIDFGDGTSTNAVGRAIVTILP